MSKARSRRSSSPPWLSSISALTRPTTFQLEKPNSALTPVYILNLNPHPQPFTSPLILQSPLPPFELFLHAQFNRILCINSRCVSVISNKLRPSRSKTSFTLAERFQTAHFYTAVHSVSWSTHTILLRNAYQVHRTRINLCD
jgi:hypothetical protein